MHVLYFKKDLCFVTKVIAIDTYKKRIYALNRSKSNIASFDLSDFSNYLIIDDDRSDFVSIYDGYCLNYLEHYDRCDLKFEDLTKEEINRILEDDKLVKFQDWYKVDDDKQIKNFESIVTSLNLEMTDYKEEQKSLFVLFKGKRISLIISCYNVQEYQIEDEDKEIYNVSVFKEDGYSYLVFDTDVRSVERMKKYSDTRYIKCKEIEYHIDVH